MIPTPGRSLPALLALSGLCLALLAGPGSGTEDGTLDVGRFTVSVGGRLVGIEEFEIESRGDSVAGYSNIRQFHGEPPNVDTLIKRVAFMVGSLDYGLRSYRSVETFRGRNLERGLLVYDTTYSSFRQFGMQGAANIHLLPPGKLFLLDPHVFANFGVLCLNLKGREFRTRPVTMIVLAPERDTVIVATATDLGPESIRWGERPVQARHLTIGDSQLTYDLWAGSDGRLVRLEHRPTQLKVERVAPPTKARAPRKPSG